MNHPTLKGLIQVLLSYGMGVESTAIILRWIFEPETCPCDLSDLTVVTAQVGDEFPDTGDLVTTHILPLFRKHGIRFVQLARSGHLEEDGITILSDTRCPDRLYLEGVYKLSDEMTINGTVPQYSGVHKCALKFKAWVIEQWLTRHFVPEKRSESADGNAVIKHAIGYNADETGRVETSEYAFAMREAEKEPACTMKVAFGFNAEEISRIENANEYDGLRGYTPCSESFIDPAAIAVKGDSAAFHREAFYPLLEWGWDRQACLDYIASKLGVTWLKSACCYCPFAANRQNMPELLRRHKLYPQEVAKAMVMERLSLSMNPRGSLYSGKSLIQITIDSGNQLAAQAYERSLATLPWALYRVRRLYNAKKGDPSKKGTVPRAVEKLEVFATQAEAEAALDVLAGRMGCQMRQIGDIHYAYLEERGEGYPTREEYFTVAPALVETKARYGIPKFDEQWDAEALQPCLFLNSKL